MFGYVARQLSGVDKLGGQSGGSPPHSKRLGAFDEVKGNGKIVSKMA